MLEFASDETTALEFYLTESSGWPGPISWNFNKFLVDWAGRVAARWGSRTAPKAKDLAGKVEEVLRSDTVTR